MSGRRVLLGPVPDIAARGACTLTEVPGAADFRTQPTRDTFGDIPRAGVMALIVTRSTFHRLVVFETVGIGASSRSADVILRTRRRVDIAEDADQNPILLYGHSTLLGQSDSQALCRLDGDHVGARRRGLLSTT